MNPVFIQILSAATASLVLGGAIGLITRLILPSIKKKESKLSFINSALIGFGATFFTGGLYFVNSMGALTEKVGRASSMHRFGSHSSSLANEAESMLISSLAISILIGTAVAIIAVVVMYNRQIVKGANSI